MVKDLDTLRALITAVFFEKHVICFGEKPHLVSGVILALVALLEPFKWKMPVIPILPNALLDFIESPFPLLAGISRSQFD